MLPMYKGNNIAVLRHVQEELGGMEQRAKAPRADRKWNEAEKRRKRNRRKQRGLGK